MQTTEATDATVPTSLTELRRVLDDIDRRLLDVVRDRIRCCVDIAHVKREYAVPMMQTGRIGVVQARAAAYADEHGLDRDFLRRFYDLIITETCRVEDEVINAPAAVPAGPPLGAAPSGPVHTAVVAGAAGAVGAMVTGMLTAAGISVTRVDLVPAAGVLAGDVTAPERPLADAVAAADAVVLAVPEPVAIAAVEPLAAVLRPDAVLIDTLSVKTGIEQKLREHAGDRPVLSLNPMFAPSLDPSGRAVAAVVPRDGDAVEQMLRVVTATGARVVRFADAAEHDRAAAAVQALTHAAVLSFGIALGDLGVDVPRLDALAPPPHTTLLALLARLVAGAPETYWDIQAGNPYAAGARSALVDAVHALVRLVDDGDAAGFAAELGRGRALLGDRLTDHERRCARLFTEARP